MQDKATKKAEATALLEELVKSKNIREQRIKTFGSSGEPNPDTKAGKILHEKQSSAVNKLAQKRYGTDIKPSGGKFRDLDFINKQHVPFFKVG